MTTSRDVLETLGTDKPSGVVALGYASWEKGQLEQKFSITRG